ncbi:HAMP domain-containing histidine kinase, partial [Microbacterium testaceum]
IARAIVEAHRGTISVQSTPGDTTFEVRLPAKPADPGPPADA